MEPADRRAGGHIHAVARRGGASSADELSAALELYFEETDMGAVPARHDCVTVGSAATLRLENMAAVLVLGLCEGEFPQPVTDTGLLTEQDKQTLENFGIEFTAARRV